jgi:hypothetical protein
MGMLLELAFVVAVWLPWALRPALRNQRRGVTLAAILGYIAGSVAVALIVANQGVSVDTAFGRFNESGGFSIRLGMWTDAIRVVAEHPLLGAGFGQYAVGQYGLAHVSGVSTNYVHNVVLQTAAELGLPLAAGLVVVVLWWARRVLREALNVKESALVLALLATLAVHALLEWPLSSLHFLVPAALLFALVEPRVMWRYGQARINSRLLVVAGAAGLALATSMKLEFDEASAVNYRTEVERKSAAGLDDDTLRLLIGLSESGLLRAYADSLLVTLRSPLAVEPTAEEIARHERVLMFGADPRVIARLVILNAKAGRFEESLRHVERLKNFAGDQYEKQAKGVLEALGSLGPEADPLRHQLALGPATNAKGAAQ